MNPFPNTILSYFSEGCNASFLNPATPIGIRLLEPSNLSRVVKNKYKIE
jgi:hypothetical protein